MALFRMTDFLSIAVKDEETGVAFYTGCANSVKNRDLKSAFIKMADQERVHAERFKKMGTEVKEHKNIEGYGGEYESYMNQFLKVRAFPEPADAAKKAQAIKSDFEAIEIALRMEKDTLLFYHEMLSFIPQTHQKYIEDIIKEERTHVNQLTDLSNTMRTL